MIIPGEYELTDEVGVSAPTIFGAYKRAAKVPVNPLESRGELSDWWQDKVDSDIERTVPKIDEYGTRDLQAMGEALATLRGIDLDSPQASIYGCMFYALGKVTRAMAALERGESPSEDTLFDLSIYSMMARSFQDRGEL